MELGSEDGEQYRFNLFVHLIFKHLVLFVTAFQLGSHFISLESGLHHLGTNTASGRLGQGRVWAKNTVHTRPSPAEASWFCIISRPAERCCPGGGAGVPGAYLTLIVVDHPFIILNRRL